MWLADLKAIYADVAQLVAQLICNQSVAGSSPVVGSIYACVAQLARASDSYPEGRWFNSNRRHH